MATREDIRMATGKGNGNSNTRRMNFLAGKYLPQVESIYAQLGLG